jgi:ribonucleoside-diphosphate reductase alpha chain
VSQKKTTAAPEAVASQMCVKKRNGSLEPIDRSIPPVVYTGTGPIPIAEVQNGDLVLTSDGEYGEVRQAFTRALDVEAVVSVHIKHSFGPQTVARDQYVLAIQNVRMETSVARVESRVASGSLGAAWVRAGQLKRGDYVAQVLPSGCEAVEGFTRDDARLYGIILGDGHLSADSAEWGVSGHPALDDHLGFTAEYLDKRGIHWWYTERGDTYQQIRWAYGHGLERCDTTGRLKGLGWSCLPFGREDVYDAQGRKRIAPRLSHLPQDQTLEMLKGLLETDGCVSRGKEVFFHNTSDPLVYGLKYQLLRLAIPCSGQLRTRKNDHVGTRSDGSIVRFSAGNTSRSYDVRIPAVPCVAEITGAKPLTKRNWLQVAGCIWSRVRNVDAAPAPSVALDLLLDRKSSYMTDSAIVCSATGGAGEHSR